VGEGKIQKGREGFDSCYITIYDVTSHQGEVATSEGSQLLDR